MFIKYKDSHYLKKKKQIIQYIINISINIIYIIY